MEPKIGQRRTQQREVIYQVIRNAPGPLTVNEVHDAALADVPNLGIATVYRNVKLLLEEGLIQAVTLPDGQSRYESADLKHHHHFHCRRCERAFDLDGCGVQIKDGSTLPGGFVVESHELTIHGLCPDCAEAPTE